MKAGRISLTIRRADERGNPPQNVIATWDAAASGPEGTGWSGPEGTGWSGPEGTGWSGPEGTGWSGPEGRGKLAPTQPNPASLAIPLARDRSVSPG